MILLSLMFLYDIRRQIMIILLSLVLYHSIYVSSSDSILCTYATIKIYASDTDAHLVHTYIGIFKVLIARVDMAGSSTIE